MKNEPHFRMVLGSSRHLGILYFQSAPGPHLRWRSGLRQQLSPPLWPWVNNVSTHGRLLRWGGFLSNLWSFDADFLVVLGTVQNPSFCVSSDVVSRLQYSLDGDVGAADSGLDQPHAASDGLTGSLRKRFLGKWISRGAETMTGEWWLLTEKNENHLRPHANGETMNRFKFPDKTTALPLQATSDSPVQPSICMDQMFKNEFAYVCRKCSGLDSCLPCAASTCVSLWPMPVGGQPFFLGGVQLLLLPFLLFWSYVQQYCFLQKNLASVRAKAKASVFMATVPAFHFSSFYPASHTRRRLPPQSKGWQKKIRNLRGPDYSSTNYDKSRVVRSNFVNPNLKWHRGIVW